MTNRQVKEIVKLLKSKDLTFRPALQQVFESGGYMWATDGYIAYELFQCGEDLMGKCASLISIRKWLAEHPNKSNMFNEWEEISTTPPDLYNLIKGEYIDSADIKLDIKRLKMCCDFLNTDYFTLKCNTKNHKLYQVIPIKDHRDILEKSLDSKAYLMGIK